MKKGLFLLIAALLLCSFSCALAGTTAMYYDEVTGKLVENSDNYVSYTLLEDGTARLDDFSLHYEKKADTVTLPSVVDGYQVTALDGYGLLWMMSKDITCVKIPPTITRIVNDEEDAWDDTLCMGEDDRKLELLGENPAFSVDECGLIYLDGALVGVNNIPEVKDAVIRPGTTRVNLNAFCMNPYITKITIPASVEEIRYSPDLDMMCALPEQVKRIDVDADNAVYFSSQGLLYSKDALIACPPDVVFPQLVIPEGIREVRSGAFVFVGRSHDRAMTVKLPQSMEIIRRGAFHGMFRLWRINIPAGLHTIEEGAFGYCYWLTHMEVSPENLNYRMQDGMLVENVAEKILVAIESGKTFTVPEGIQCIGDNAFSNGMEMEEISLPETLTEIGSNAFAYSGLKQLVIPSSVKRIGTSAFLSSELTSVSFANQRTALEALPMGAFEFCEQLTCVRIPRDAPMKTIGEDAFYCCEALAQVELPEGLERIGENAFMQCNALKKIDLPRNLEELGEGAFWDCGALTSLIIPEKVKTFNVSYLGDDSGLKTLVFMGETQITGYAFDSKTLFVVNSDEALAWCKENKVEHDQLYRWAFKRGPLKVTETTDPQLQAVLDAGGAMNYEFEEILEPSFTTYYGKKIAYGHREKSKLHVSITLADGRTAKREYACRLEKDRLVMDDEYLSFTIEDYRTIGIRSANWSMKLEGAELE